MHAGGAVRTVHVAAAAIVVLGLSLAAARPALARRVEWVFWAAALVLIITGIGNLGTVGGPLPGEWGARFSWKLALVLALLLGSATRILILALAPQAREARTAYAATALVAAGAAALGLVLAHG